MAWKVDRTKWNTLTLLWVGNSVGNSDVVGDSDVW